MEEEQITAILIDDEDFAINNLSELIKSYCPLIKIIATVSSVPEASVKIDQMKPDAIFLDINMPGQSGFDLLDLIKHIPSVVFVSAHEKYALMAMKLCAVDFILKPINITELINTQAKLQQIKAIQPEIRKIYYEVLRNLSGMMQKKLTMRKITLRRNNEYEIFDMDDIIYLSGVNNYTTFYFQSLKPLMIAKTLKEFTEMLEPYGFMRIHKSTLVNLVHVKKTLRNDGVEVVLNNGQILEVSRRKSNEFMEWMKR